MSRIFDACRQYLKSETRDAPGDSPDAGQAGSEVFSFPELRPKLWETFPVVTCQPGPDDRLLAGVQHHGLGLEKFHLLSHRLTEIRRKWPLKSLAVSSCVSQEGKTLVAVNLALTFARNPGRVLLLDGDMRQPGVSSALKMGPLPGLAEYLEGSQEFDGLVRRIEPYGIFCLPAGRASGNPFDLLQGERMGELMQRLAPIFDWIIVDSLLVPFADGYCLAKLSDAALLVVRPGLTPRDVVDKAVAILEGVRIAGVVWNASDESGHDRYYYGKDNRDSATAAAEASTAPGGKAPQE